MQVLSVALPAEVIYCTGTVNGVEAVWTNVSDNTWESTVERAADETYMVELLMVNALGSTTTQTFSLFYGLVNLITDRTEEDFVRWKQLRDKGWAAMTESEREEWRSPMKGSYNHVDMNRVESAVQHIAHRMSELGYLVNPDVKTTWSLSDNPTRADMDRYFGNVAKLRSMITVYATTPAPITTNVKFDYRAANDLEKTLIDVDDLITKISRSWFYSGEIFAGEV